MSFKDNYPLTPPTLSLDFVNASGVDPRVTFSRSSTATYCNSAGLITLADVNVPRIDYDPITHECKGLLIEESRTNLLTYSEQFDNAAWIASNSTLTANATTAPDGTTTADKLVANNLQSLTGSDSFGGVYFNSAYSTSSAVTYSFFVKPANIAYCRIRETVETGCRIVFNLTDGTYVYEAGNSAQVSVFSVQKINNGWWRISITRTPTASVRYVIKQGNDTGDGTNGIYIWGAQLEVGAFPTSYFPTTNGQGVRWADNASMTGTAFSSWYNQSEGTVAVEYDRLSNITASGYPRVYSITDGTLLNEIDAVQQTGSGEYFSINTTGTNQTLIANITVTVGNPIKTASSYATNNVNSATNTILGVSDNLATIPSVTRLDFGNRFDGLRPLNGHIKSFKYYPIRLTNAQLQTLTNP